MDVNTHLGLNQLFNQLLIVRINPQDPAALPELMFEQTGVGIRQD